MEMTKKTVRKICVDLNLYSTPELNDVLYLHYKGFKKIENLDAYTGCKVLYLEGNGLKEIEGLEQLTALRTLYLQENMFEYIEGLEAQTDVDTINLDQNFITIIENLGHMHNLRTLMLKRNRIKETKNLSGLSELKSLSVLNLSENLIQDAGVLDFLGTLPNLKVLYLKGNPFVAKTKQYRRNTILKCKQLTYLDDRPVFPAERLCVEAWGRGGMEAERAEKDRQRVEKDKKAEEQHLMFQKMIDDAHAAKNTTDEVKVNEAEPAVESKHTLITEVVSDGDEETGANTFITDVAVDVAVEATVEAVNVLDEMD